MNKTYEDRKEKGLCTSCGKPRDREDRMTCADCREARRQAWAFASAEKRKTEKARQRAVYNRRVIMGICTRCGKTAPRQGRSLCDVCAEKAAAYYRDRKKQQKSEDGKNE